MAGVEAPMVWRTDRFHPHKKEDIAGMDKHFPHGGATLSSKMQMLSQVMAERKEVVQLITKTIDNMVVQVGNFCGLCVMSNGGFSRRPCTNRTEIRDALKNVADEKRQWAIFLFIYNYFGRVVYERSIGTTHQAACEAAVMQRMNISFQGLGNFSARNQSCIGKVYTLLLNKRQQRMREQVFRFNIRLGVESNEIKKLTKSRRGKSVFYIRRLVFNHGNPSKRTYTEEEEVRLQMGV